MRVKSQAETEAPPVPDSFGFLGLQGWESNPHLPVIGRLFYRRTTLHAYFSYEPILKKVP